MPDTASENLETEATETDGWEWAVVEIFGHRKHAGRVREEERFGAKMLRIDVPVFATPEAADAGEPERWETRWYGGGSIFSMSLTDERSVRRANRPYAAPARISAPNYDDDFDREPSAADYEQAYDGEG